MHENTITFSCCCKDTNCPRLQEFHESFKRVEYDAHLAAGKLDSTTIHCSNN